MYYNKSKLNCEVKRLVFTLISFSYYMTAGKYDKWGLICPLESCHSVPFH